MLKLLNPIRGFDCEENLAAQPYEAQTDSRLFEAQRRQRRKTCPQAPAPEGPQALGGRDQREMTVVPATFPKSARLLKRQDFRFRPFSRFHSENFSFIYSTGGSARVGISISKKVLKRAACRNRVRRLAREAFRLHRASFRGLDVHLVGRDPLTQNWASLKRQDFERQFEAFLVTVRRQHG
jgi:ribonuclease P protein component